MTGSFPLGLGRECVCVRCVGGVSVCASYCVTGDEFKEPPQDIVAVDGYFVRLCGGAVRPSKSRSASQPEASPISAALPLPTPAHNVSIVPMLFFWGSGRDLNIIKAEVGL